MRFCFKPGDFLGARMEDVGLLSRKRGFGIGGHVRILIIKANYYLQYRESDRYLYL